MPDFLAIFSQARFERESKRARPGDILPIARYTNLESMRAPLGRFSRIDRLVLVTVRPGDGSLWLIAVLEAPELAGVTWTSRPNRTPIADVSALRNDLGLTGELAQGPEAPPRLLSPAQLTLLLGPGAAPSVDRPSSQFARFARELTEVRGIIEERARKRGTSMPDTLTDLFDIARADPASFEALELLGIVLGKSSFDIGDSEESVDEHDDRGAPQRPAILERFVGFATNGCGDVFGLVAASPEEPPCVIQFFHEDGHFELVGHDVADWLERSLRESEECALDEGDGMVEIERLRSRLPALVRAPDRPTPAWVMALGAR